MEYEIVWNGTIHRKRQQAEQHEPPHAQNVGDVQGAVLVALKRLGSAGATMRELRGDLGWSGPQISSALYYLRRLGLVTASEREPQGPKRLVRRYRVTQGN